MTPRRPRAASNADGTAGVTDNDDNDLDSRLQRARRQAGHETDHYFLITFHIVLPYEEGNGSSPEDTYQVFVFPPWPEWVIALDPLLVSVYCVPVSVLL